jgi:hypothetical protein
MNVIKPYPAEDRLPHQQRHCHPFGTLITTIRNAGSYYWGLNYNWNNEFYEDGQKL